MLTFLFGRMTNWKDDVNVTEALNAMNELVNF